MTVELMLGDCLDIMATLPDNSVDTIITDPPYGLGFMGKDWDKGVPGIHFWSEMLRIAKPGATLMAMGGTRTYHRLASAIEDEGWRIIDMIEWLYGSGFPKSYDIGKQLENWEGWGTALKPAHEPICVAYKPREGTYVNNALTWGVAGLWIDGGRVETSDKLGGGSLSGSVSASEGWDRPWRHDEEAIKAKIERVKESVSKGETLGRFPANVIHDGSDEVTGLFPQSSPAGTQTTRKTADGMFGMGHDNGLNTWHNDSGSAARFFYCAKASRSERNAGLEGMPEKDGGHYAQDEWSRKNMGNKPDAERKPVQNHHPTVKPLALMRYLARLTKTPTGGVVLDPFMGSGTTGIACVNEGRDFIGIEQDAEYMEIARRRIEYWQKQVQPRLL